MSTQEDELVRFLKLLDETGCLEHVVLIGSWAEYAYWRAGLLGGFLPNIRTLDMDFLVRNMRKPVPKAHLAMAARDHGYLVESDRLTGVTKIYSPGGLEVEFLIGKVVAGLEDSLRTNLSVVAQSLRHLDILARNTTVVEVGGLMVSVPAPEAYAVHKMVVNHERGTKRKKDADAVVGLWPYLDRHSLTSMLSTLTKKERARAEEFMAQHRLEV